MSGLNVVILSGRTLRQGVGKEAGKTSERYRSSVSVCEMHPDDIASLSIKSGDNVKVSTSHGEVILKSASSNQIINPGMIFIPYGIYANQLFNDITESSGMPNFKGQPGIIEAAAEESIKTLEQLVEEIR